MFQENYSDFGAEYLQVYVFEYVPSIQNNGVSQSLLVIPWDVNFGILNRRTCNVLLLSSAVFDIFKISLEKLDLKTKTNIS